MNRSEELWNDMQAALERVYEGKVTHDSDPGYRAGWNDAMRWARDEVRYERDQARRHHPQFPLPAAELFEEAS